MQWSHYLYIILSVAFVFTFSHCLFALTVVNETPTEKFMRNYGSKILFAIFLFIFIASLAFVISEMIKERQARKDAIALSKTFSEETLQMLVKQKNQTELSEDDIKGLLALEKNPSKLKQLVYKKHTRWRFAYWLFFLILIMPFIFHESISSSVGIILLIIITGVYVFQEISDIHERIEGILKTFKKGN